MRTWHRQSPAAHVLFSDKLILRAMAGGVVLLSVALSPNANVI